MSTAWIGAWLFLPYFLLGNALLYRIARDPEVHHWPWLVAAVVAFALDRDVRRAKLPEASIAVGGVSAVGALLAPSIEMRTSFAILAIVEPLAALASRARTRSDSRLGRALHVGRVGLRTAGLVGVGIGLLELALVPVLARVHDLPLLDPVAAKLLSWVGVDAGYGADGFFLRGSSNNSFFRMSAEKLALGPAVLLFAGGWLARLSTGRRIEARLLLMTLAAWLVYLFVRSLGVVAVAGGTAEMSWLFEPWVVLVSLVPLAILLASFLRPPSEVVDGASGLPESAVAAPYGAKPGAALVATALVVVGGLSLFVHDPGARKPGRVLVDEYHSEWEWSDEPFTDETYGSQTTYNYYNLVEFLGRYYPTVDRNYDELTAELLADYDVLVLKTPTLLYSEAECASIMSFIERGGGVWLIGDHTDVFGTSTVLNQIGTKVGIRFVSDALEELPHHERQMLSVPATGRHPMAHAMPGMLMATSCSLELDPSVSSPLIGDTLHSDRASYATFNFFGDHSVDGTESFGLFPQVAAVHHGRGRVAAFTDSTTLSNFSIYYPGKWELSLSTIEWLNRTNGDRFVLAARWVLGAGFVVALAFLGIRRRSALLAPLPCLATGLLVALSVADAHVAAAHPLPEPHTPYPVIAFEREHCEYLLPIDHETHDWDPNSYDTFFVWTQRRGQTPRVAETFDAALQHENVVFIRPSRALDDEKARALREWVEDGGSLLVLDELDRASAANQILSPFGLSLVPAEGGVEVDLSSIASFGAESRLSIPTASFVRGGTPVVFDTEGRALASVARVGAGRVVAASFARSLSVDRIGLVRDLPSEAQLALSELEYVLLDAMALESNP